MRLLLLAVAFAGLLACESGTSTTYNVDLADSTTTTFSETEPGILRLNGSVARVLCGQRVDPFEIHQDDGLGCLDDALKDTEVTLQAWIEPAGATFDLPALCALPVEERQFLSLPLEVRGEAYEAPTEPLAEWVQTRSTGTWRRNGSPCGGRLSVDFSL